MLLTTGDFRAAGITGLPQLLAVAGTRDVSGSTGSTCADKAWASSALIALSWRERPR